MTAMGLSVPSSVARTWNPIGDVSELLAAHAHVPVISRPG